MLTNFQKSKFDEWEAWRYINPDDGIMPHGLGVINTWYEAQGMHNGDPFPTAEQMTPTRADFGLEG